MFLMGALDESWRIIARVLGSPGLRRLTFHTLKANAVTLLIMRTQMMSSTRYS